MANRAAGVGRSDRAMPDRVRIFDDLAAIAYHPRSCDRAAKIEDISIDAISLGKSIDDNNRYSRNGLLSE